MEKMISNVSNVSVSCTLPSVVLLADGEERSRELEHWIREMTGDAPTVFFNLGMFQENLAGIQGCTLVIYAPADEALARAMAAGASPQQALANWRASATQLCQLRRSNRDKILLVNFNSLRHQLGEALAACGLVTVGALHSPFPLEEPSLLFRLLAMELLRQDSTAKSVSSELEASSVAVWDTPPNMNVDAILSEVRAARNARVAMLEADLAALDREQEALLGQLLKAQEKVAVAVGRIEELEIQHAELRKRRRIHERQCDGLRKELELVKSKRARIIFYSSTWLTTPLRWISSKISKKL